jgi:DNA-directed RNA polymerase specialized sigma24 family protein
MKNSGAYKHNIWMHIYGDRYEELFSYSIKLTDGNKVLAEEMVRTLSIAYFTNEKKLKEAIAKLPPTYPEVVELFFLHSVPAREITQRLPLSIHQVKRRLVVSLFYLRREMNPNYIPNFLKSVEKRRTYMR